MPAAAIPAVMGLVGTGLSYFGQKEASEAAQQGANAQTSAMNQANQLAAQQYADEKALYDPVRKKLISQNMAAIPSDYAQYTNAINKNYGNVERNMLNGSVQNSGLVTSQIQGAEMNKASSLAEAYNRAKQEQSRNLMALLGHDRSAQMAQSALGTQENLANMYGNQAAIAGRNAQLGSQGVISGIGGLAKLDWNKIFNSNSTTTNNTAPTTNASSNNSPYFGLGVTAYNPAPPPPDMFGFGGQQ